MSKTHRKHNETKGGFIEDQREFFNELIVEDWNTYINSEWDLVRKLEVSEILKRISLPEKILDIGCGCGYHDIIFADNVKIKNIVGIDYSANSIAKANIEYCSPKVTRFVADIFRETREIERLGPFDLVCSFQVIEHITNPIDFLDRCKKLVRDGGYIAIVTPNYQKLQNIILRLQRKPVEFIDPLHFAEYNIDDLKRIGKKAGLNFFDYFGRGLTLNVGKYRIIKPYSKTERLTVKLFPGISDVIGIIFKR